MNESLNKLFLKLGSDKELFSQMINKDTVDEMYKFCLTIQGGDYSRDEFERVVIELMRQLVKWRRLSDDDLDKVSGGSFIDGIEIGKEIKAIFRKIF